MPRKTNTIVARKIDYGVYLCESWEDPKHPHTVNLHANNGNGYCSCKDFKERCLSNWRSNGRKVVDYGITGNPNKNRTLCRHLKCCRWLWANEKLREESKICEPE